MVMIGKRERRVCSGCRELRPVKVIRGRMLVWVHYPEGRQCPGSNSPPLR